MSRGNTGPCINERRPASDTHTCARQEEKHGQRTHPSTEQRRAIGKTPKNYPANGYITKIPKDPWGNDYVYTAPGQKVPFEIMSLGSDGAEGGEGEAADIWGEDVPDR